MRKIFIDIGGWDGTSAEFFRKTHDLGEEFEIFTFECDKNNIEKIKKRNVRTYLIEKAAWSSDGKIKYYYGNDDGGTLYSSKTTGNINPENFYIIETIDIAKFIKNNFSKDDYIIIKMNCEGSEYEIIPHLKNNNLIDWINIWYIQWHFKKIKLGNETHNEIQKMIPKFLPWKAQSKGEFKEFKKTL